MLLTGTYARTLDEKLRVAVPKGIRESWGTTERPNLFWTLGTDGSLALYTEEVLSLLGERLAAASPGLIESRAFSRLFYSQAVRAEMDAQGRIRLPAALAEMAGIAKEIVLVGVQDRVEVWDKTRWETYLEQRRTQFDELAEAAFRKSI